MTDARNKVILLAHGDGGALTHQLIEQLFGRYFSNTVLRQLNDAAVCPSVNGRIAITTDSFVIDPLFFPGGDIGKLAICGTINDLAVAGAHPRYIAAAFMIEEGLEIDTLERVVASMAVSCEEAGVEIVAGDTKVVARGQLDKLFITTTGIGWIPEEIHLGYHRIQPGDLVLVNGDLGEHGMAVMIKRYGFTLAEVLKSDCAPLHHICRQVIHQCPGVKMMRDLTRGGFATAIKEIALSSSQDIRLEEADLPVNPAVQSAASILGLDPLYLANEGKFLLIISPQEAEKALQILKQHPLGHHTRIVGEVQQGEGNVYVKTILGGTRSLGLMAGMPLPRIC